jgi:phosphocarrier protein
MKSSNVTIKAAIGLHARPAALFVKAAQKHTSNVTVKYNEKTVNAKSLLSLLSLGVTKDATILIQATGEDEEAALNDLVTLVNTNFGE